MPTQDLDAAHAEHHHAGDQQDEQPERGAGPLDGGDEGDHQCGQREPLPVEQRVGEQVAGAEAAFAEAMR